jgi:hypothetical protein
LRFVLEAFDSLVILVPPARLEAEHVNTIRSKGLEDSQESSGAESGAFRTNSDLTAASADPDLAALIGRWASLPLAAKSAILTVLKSIE